MRECKMVEDLLEIYVENLTSEITNKYIEKHISCCSRCKRKLQKTSKSVKLNESDCAIIFDLLPNYIEKMTCKTTNEYIEEHLKSCHKCLQAFEDMAR